MLLTLSVRVCHERGGSIWVMVLRGFMMVVVMDVHNFTAMGGLVRSQVTQIAFQIREEGAETAMAVCTPVMSALFDLLLLLHFS